GIYLSAHPLDDYRIILKCMCNTHCKEMGDKETLVKRKNITVGGIVTGVKSKFTKKGKPCGFVTLEDFEGNGELALFGEDWGKWKGMLAEGCIVFIHAECVPRQHDPNIHDLRITNIQYMQTVKDEQIERFTITIDSSAIDETIVSDIATMVADSPGKTQLLFQIIDKEHNTNLTLRSRTKNIYLKNDLVSYIECHDDMSYQVN
ncbi:MAG: DNA polymerase III subunit alpha, partial [Prevotella sp.]|nr:DNA polymerase III subunit alpha [Prevotella sp.]